MQDILSYFVTFSKILNQEFNKISKYQCIINNYEFDQNKLLVGGVQAYF